jgi:hypothetical protein
MEKEGQEYLVLKCQVHLISEANIPCAFCSIAAISTTAQLEFQCSLMKPQSAALTVPPLRFGKGF